jgi:predicted ATPase
MSNPTVSERETGSSHTSSPLLLQSLRPSNVLSFGPNTPEIPLGPLNLLIGPNGCGKSNFIEAICLLRATSGDVQQVVRKGGGVREWIWKGGARSASVEAVVQYYSESEGISHTIEFADVQHTLGVLSEQIESSQIRQHIDVLQRFYDLKFQPVSVTLMGKPIALSAVDRYSSILTQRRDPDLYPQITYLAEQYADIRVYREWQFGRNSVFREPQRADMRTDRLEEDFPILGSF